MKILILGVSGMLGSAVFRYFNRYSAHDIWGFLRSKSLIEKFSEKYKNKILSDYDVENYLDLERLMLDVKPDVVINCIGIIKQVGDANNNEKLVAINSLLPHRLDKILNKNNARLIHISTDCVFSGEFGGYLEEDTPTATDIYGRSKLLGEIDGNKSITLRTSIIGHELATKNSLLEWFLSQDIECLGYNKAIFSGLTTIELARVLLNIVIEDAGLYGVYHVASKPISKYDLLLLVASVYNKDISITQDSSVVINRSLCADKFNQKTGYTPPEWEQMISTMRENYMLEINDLN